MAAAAVAVATACQLGRPPSPSHHGGGRRPHQWAAAVDRALYLELPGVEEPRHGGREGVEGKPHHVVVASRNARDEGAAHALVDGATPADEENARRDRGEGQVARRKTRLASKQSTHARTRETRARGAVRRAPQPTSRATCMHGRLGSDLCPGGGTPHLPGCHTSRPCPSAPPSGCRQQWSRATGAQSAPCRAPPDTSVPSQQTRHNGSHPRQASVTKRCKRRPPA